MRGLTTVMLVLLVETTVTGIGVPPEPGSKRTEIGSRKFAPLIVTSCPPAGLSSAGEAELIVGVVTIGGVMIGVSLNEITTALVTLLTVAVTAAVPALLAVRVIVVLPLTVVRMAVFDGVSAVLVSTNWPKFVTNSTAVPSGAGALPTVTVAVM